METLIWIHNTCIIWMTAVIWCVQLIIYPSFRRISSEHFKKFHDVHTRNITLIVAPAMLLELATAYLIFWTDPQNPTSIQFMVCIHLIFLSTLFLSIPYHHSLQREYSKAAALKLERFNWIRTLLWTYEFIILLFFYTKTK